MKKIITAFSLFAFSLGLFLPFQGASAAEAVCYNFVRDMKEGNVVVSTGSRYGGGGGLYSPDLKALQSILEAEGFSVPSSEKGRSISKGTAGAIAAFQNKYKADILTPQGLTHGFGWVDQKTREVLNQKHGCIAKATLVIHEPTGNPIKAKGETMKIRWTAAQIPNTSTLSIKYAKENGTGTTTITTKTSIKNGVGTHEWVIPQTIEAGKYKILLSLDGSVKSSVSTAAFEIRDASLEVVSPNGGQTLTAGAKTDITWKSSSALNANSLVTIKLVKEPASGSTYADVYQIVQVRNTGSYSWTVPKNVGNTIIANGEKYRIKITSGSSEDLSNSAFTISASTFPKVSVTAAMTATVQRNTAHAITWTHSNTADAKANVSLVPTGSAGTKVVLKSNVLLSSGRADVTIPANATAGSYKIVLEPAGSIVLDSSSTKETNSFSIPALVEDFVLTAPAAGKTLKPGEILTAYWTYSNLPGTAAVTIKLSGGPNNTETTLVSSGLTAAARGRSVTIPAGTVDGTYRLKFEVTKADGTKLPVLSQTFTVMSTQAKFSVIGTPTIATTTVGGVEYLRATFVTKAEAFGGVMIKPVATDFSVAIKYADGGSLIGSGPVAVTVAPNANIAAGGSATVTVTADFAVSAVTKNVPVKAAIQSIKWKLGTLAKTVTTGLESFVTPTVTLSN